jgi:CRP-like cAMP-binding protein
MTNPSHSSFELQTIRTLAAGRDLLSLASGDVIFKDGEPGDCLYGVVQGEVKLSWNDGSQWETFGPGSTFGVGALIDPDHRRFGTATALSDSQLLLMNREEFLLAVQELPMFGLEMIHDLDQRLRHLKAGTL